jgi:3-oxoacyl-[acyl-carrier protein] reductase
MIIPGRISTERINELDALAAKRENKSIHEVVSASLASIPVGRYGSVEEFAAVAAFLVSAQAAYITGSIVRVDGGYIRSI